MLNCTVIENKMGHLTVTFDDNRDIYLQSDYERCQFGVACGAIKAPRGWYGVPNHLIRWWEEDFEAITQCPEYYIHSAE